MPFIGKYLINGLLEEDDKVETDPKIDMLHDIPKDTGEDTDQNNADLNDTDMDDEDIKPEWSKDDENKLYDFGKRMDKLFNDIIDLNRDLQVFKDTPKLTKTMISKMSEAFRNIADAISQFREITYSDMKNWNEYRDARFPKRK